jgi:hypothetical protein
MTAWTAEELDHIAAADELELTALRPDGKPRAPVTIWVVGVGGGLYVRSWRGASGRWFRAVKARPEGHIRAGGVDRDVELVAGEKQLEDAVDEASRTKYARYASYVEPMVSPDARATTLELLPRAGEVR